MAKTGTSRPRPAGGLPPERGRQHPDRRPAVGDENFWALFESAPDAYLVLAPDPPRFTMVAANAARLRVTMTRREDVIRRGLFEVLSGQPGRSRLLGGDITVESQVGRGSTFTLWLPRAGVRGTG